MDGGIYENHSGRGARWRVRFPGVHRRFNDLAAAKRFLNGLRYESDKGVFDPRDYQKDNPLGLENLVKEWLDKKSLEGMKCYRNLPLHMGKATEFFGNCNIKSVTTREAERFRSWLLRDERWSSKYKSGILTTFGSFLKWVAKIEKGFPIPEVEPIEYEMAMRKIIDKDTQIEVLEEIRNLTWRLNPKIYIACLWLSTYVNVRPIELMSIMESDIDLDAGVVYLRRNKEGRTDKRLYLLEEDIDYLKSLPRSLYPERTYFFRHSVPRRGLPAHRLGRFGKRYLYKWWKRACDNLGIEGVDLYGGTRHSSASDLGRYYSPEEVMSDGTGHTTSKSFLRYFHIREEKKRAVARAARSGGLEVARITEATSKG